MNNKKAITVKGRIVSKEGDTEFSGTLQEATALIAEHQKQHGKWTFVQADLTGNGVSVPKPFFFHKYDQAEMTELENLLTSVENPQFVVSPAAQGGGCNKQKSVRLTAVSQNTPMAWINDKACSLKVRITKRGKRDRAEIFVSEFKGGAAKLRKHKAQILAAIDEVLSS